MNTCDCCGLFKTDCVCGHNTIRSDWSWVSDDDDTNRDGWMEVRVWKFKSSNELQNDCISVNLKFVSYQRTMSGLIVCGLEFRPM
ncbi:putative phloem protein [Helianthus anomalus]